MRVFGAALGFELRRALRAPDTVKIRLLPGLLLVPLLATITMAAVTVTDTRAVVALPAEGGPDAALLERALGGERLRARFVPDPRAALEAGEAELAVLAWEPGGYAPTRPWDDRPDARWRALVQARDEDGERRLASALEEVGEALIEGEVLLAGGDPAWAAVAEIDEPPTARGGLSRLIQVVPDTGYVLAFAFLGIYGLMFSLPVAGLQDRKAGVSEALAVLPVPAFLLHAARLLAWCLLAALPSAIFIAELMLFAGDTRPLPSAGAVLAGLGALLLCAAATSVTGIACRSPVTAMNLGPAVGLGLLGGMAAGSWLSPPGWAPVIGLMTRDGPWALALAGAISTGLAAAIVALGARVERARIEEGA